jgi:hypothetical protein
MESPTALNCPKCSHAWSEELAFQSEPFLCGGCDTLSTVLAWPALGTGAQSGQDSALADEGEASCYNHADKQASESCEICGRFICALCDLQLDGKHQCPRCATGEGSQDSRFKGRKFRWDMAVLGISILSCVFFFFFLFIFTAPITFYLAIRHWRRPMSVAEDRRHWWGKYARFTISLLIAGFWFFVMITFVIKMLS